MMNELYYSTGRGWGMIPDFDNDGRIEQWEGTAADAWQSMRGDGCGAMDPTCRLSPQPRMGAASPVVGARLAVQVLQDVDAAMLCLGVGLLLACCSRWQS